MDAPAILGENAPGWLVINSKRYRLSPADSVDMPRPKRYKKGAPGVIIPEGYMPTIEARETMQCSKSTIDYAIRHGWVNKKKIGASCFVNIEELRRYIAMPKHEKIIRGKAMRKAALVAG